MSNAQPGTMVPPTDLNRFVFIRWEDSVMYVDSQVWKPIGHTRHMAQHLANIEHHTVGLVLEQTEEYILVTHSVRVDGSCTASISIPMSAVKEIIEMKPIEDGRKNG